MTAPSPAAPEAAPSPAAPEAAPRFADIIPFRLAELREVAPQVFTSEGRVRHLLRRRARNGLQGHLLWVGRQPFATADSLRAWLLSLAERE